MIPTSFRVPLFSINFNNARALSGGNGLPFKALLLGQKTSEGTAVAGTPVRIFSAEAAAILGGPGSQIHRGAKAYFSQNPGQELWCLPQADPSGAKAKHTIYTSQSSIPTSSEVLHLYVDGAYLPVYGNGVDHWNILITRTLNAISDLPFVVTDDDTEYANNYLEAKNIGEAGNDLKIQFNLKEGQVYPDSILSYIKFDPAESEDADTSVVSGTGSPDLTNSNTGLAKLVDEWFQVVFGPYTDTTALDAIEAWLMTRFGEKKMIDGRYFSAIRGTKADSITFGEGLNSFNMVIQNTVGLAVGTLEFGAMTAAIAIREFALNPALPFQTLKYAGIFGPRLQDKMSLDDNNDLLHSGISTWESNNFGQVFITRLITTYQKDPTTESPDASYLDLFVLQNLSFQRWDLRTKILAKYGRSSLAKDGTSLPSNRKIVTPAVLRGECISIFSQWLELGLVQNPEQFAEDLRVEINSQDQNRVDFTVSPTQIGAFIVGTVDYQFLLQNA